MVKSHIFQFTGICPAAKSRNKYVRDSRNRAEMNMVVGFDCFYRLIRRHESDIFHNNYREVIQ